MKIVVLSSHTPSLFWFRLEMMQCFRSKGYEVTAVGNESQDAWQDKFAEKGVKYIQADISRNGTNPLKDLHTYRSLLRILKEEKPDKIFAYQAKTVIYGGLAAHSLGIKEFYPLIAGMGSVFLSDGLKEKIIRTILVTEYRTSLKHAKTVFFQNDDDIEMFEKHKIIKREKTTIIHGSGVNTSRFTVQEQPERFAFLYIGRLIRDKGIGEYLESAKIVKGKYPDVRFLVVGPYDTNPSAITPDDLQVYLNDGIIEYFGEQSDVRPYLAQCSVYVLPSYREGTPKTVLEAMACGKAVITTDAPGCRETVKEGINGYLVPIKDAKSVADKMMYFIEHSESIQTMGLEGRKIAEDVFDVNKVNEHICRTMNI